MLDGQNISSEPPSMYKIIGADQKEYGPVNADELRAWIGQGRANGQTLVMVENGPWKPLSSYPEFADTLRTATASAPPSLSSSPLASPRASIETRTVQVPGILLIVAGAIGAMANSLNLLGHVLGRAFFQTQSSGNPELDNFVQIMSGSLGLLFYSFALALNVLVIVGGWRMTRLSNYGWCFAAAVVAVVPCLSPCCCLGVPPGIWALIILSRPEVKAAFENRAL
jgi:hypothetical protein